MLLYSVKTIPVQKQLRNGYNLNTYRQLGLLLFRPPPLRLLSLAVEKPSGNSEYSTEAQHDASDSGFEPRQVRLRLGSQQQATHMMED